MIKRISVRFYGESKADMAAYDKLNKFREYGFNTAREFIIAAVNQYLGDGRCTDAPPFDPDDLAERIATRLNGVLMINKENIVEAASTDDNTEAFDEALSFIESL